jgi:hypothetical protein
MEQTTTSSAEAGKRPTFLTVLCILSFIFSGLGIIGLIIALLGMGALQTAANMAENAGGTITSTGPSMGMMWVNLIVGFVCLIAGLFGVIQMWKLRKTGFFIYAGTTVINFIVGIVAMGFSMWSIPALLFVVLYGMNLKHLK